MRTNIKTTVKFDVLKILNYILLKKIKSRISSVVFNGGIVSKSSSLTYFINDQNL